MERDENLLFVGNFSEELGFKTYEDGSEEIWEILWTTDYLFDRFSDKVRWQSLEPHQIINHLPGMTFLTNKLHLSVSSASKFIPSAFNFPTLKNEFLYFAKSKPKALYVKKTYDRSEINILKYDEVNFQMGSWNYIQELISNPLLVDGRAFDIGVYVLITSIEPLRVYRWNLDILMRFCSSEYLPFNHSIIEKANCAINSLDTSQMPSFKNLVNDLKFSNIDVLNYYVESTQDPQKLWSQIDEAISTIILQKSQSILKYVETWKLQSKNKTGKAFELLKFDFVIDDELKVHLVEIDMSPNMVYEGVGKERNELMMKRLLRDTFNILGAGSFAEVMEMSNSTMTSSSRSIAVNIEVCTQHCIESCVSPTCDLCLPCIKDENLIQTLHQSYREHQRRGEFLRVFPSNEFKKESSDFEMTKNSKFLSLWFEEKCQVDSEWCR